GREVSDTPESVERGQVHRTRLRGSKYSGLAREGADRSKSALASAVSPAAGAEPLPFDDSGVRRLGQRWFGGSVSDGSAARSAAASGGEDRSNGGDFALLKRRRLDLRLEALFAYRALCRRASRRPYQAVGERIGSRTCLQIKRKATDRRPQNSGSESGRSGQPVLFRWLPGGWAVLGWDSVKLSSSDRGHRLWCRAHRNRQ